LKETQKRAAKKEPRRLLRREEANERHQKRKRTRRPKSSVGENRESVGGGGKLEEGVTIKQLKDRRPRARPQLFPTEVEKACNFLIGNEEEIQKIEQKTACLVWEGTRLVQSIKPLQKREGGEGGSPRAGSQMYISEKRILYLARSKAFSLGTRKHAGGKDQAPSRRREGDTTEPERKGCGEDSSHAMSNPRFPVDTQERDLTKDR